MFPPDAFQQLSQSVDRGVQNGLQSGMNKYINPKLREIEASIAKIRPYAIGQLVFLNVILLVLAIAAIYIAYKSKRK